MAVVKTKGIYHLDNVSTRHILDLLKHRHRKDVFVEECKNGETWGKRDLLKIDAWALLRTYSPPTTIGYEIKVSRSDFEQDQKWTGYIGLSNYFNFVCPAGLIRSTDLPEGVGLIWVSGTGKLHTKRKPDRVIPDAVKMNQLLTYLVMSRSVIVASMYEANEGKVPEATDPIKAKIEAVKEANERQDLVYLVNGNIKMIYNQVKQKERELGRREDTMQRFEGHLAELGITWDSNNLSWHDNGAVEQQIRELKQTIGWQDIGSMKAIGERLQQLAVNLEILMKAGKQQ